MFFPLVKVRTAWSACYYFTGSRNHSGLAAAESTQKKSGAAALNNIPLSTPLIPRARWSRKPPRYDWPALAAHRRGNSQTAFELYNVQYGARLRKENETGRLRKKLRNKEDKLQRVSSTGVLAPNGVRNIPWHSPPAFSGQKDPAFIGDLYVCMGP
jgi:hypothetical protein